MNSDCVLPTRSPLESSDFMSADCYSDVCPYLSHLEWISAEQLATCITGSSRTTLIDVRSFVSFNRLHIRGALNANCVDRIARRRYQTGRLSVIDLIVNKENGTKSSESAKLDGTIVIYDENSTNCNTQLHSESCQHPFQIIKCLLRDIATHPLFLSGGFQTFNSKYSELCVTEMHPVSLRLPSYPDVMGQLEQCRNEIRTACVTQLLPFLFIGNQYDACNVKQLQLCGISHVLNVSHESTVHHEHLNLTYKSFPVRDNCCEDVRQYFEEAVKYIDSARIFNKSVLVHCKAGVSRSPTIAIAYMMHHLQAPMSDVYQRVKSLRPIISPNLNFMGQLLEWESYLLHSSNTVAEQSYSHSHGFPRDN